MGADGQTILLRGRDLERPLRDCLAPVLAAGRCSAVAVMHCDVEASGRALDIVFQGWQGPVACYPECGEWENPNWHFGELGPEAFATAAEAWARRGVRVIGGCCGINPDHIKSLSSRLRGRKWSAQH